MHVKKKKNSQARTSNRGSPKYSCLTCKHVFFYRFQVCEIYSDRGILGFILKEVGRKGNQTLQQVLIGIILFFTQARVHNNFKVKLEYLHF